MARNLIIKTKMKKFGDEEIECIYTKMREPVTMEELEKIPVDQRENYDYLPPLNHRTYIPEDGILCEQDIPVKMRDGVTIYVDMYRPITEEKVPVIISWSFYGKRPFEGQSEWKVMGVPPELFPICPSLNLPTRASGAARAMPWPTWIQEVSDIRREILSSSEARTARMDTTLSNG